MGLLLGTFMVSVWFTDHDAVCRQSLIFRAYKQNFKPGFLNSGLCLVSLYQCIAPNRLTISEHRARDRSSCVPVPG